MEQDQCLCRKALGAMDELEKKLRCGDMNLEEFKAHMYKYKIQQRFFESTLTHSIKFGPTALCTKIFKD